MSVPWRLGDVICRRRAPNADGVQGHSMTMQSSSLNVGKFTKTWGNCIPFRGDSARVVTVKPEERRITQRRYQLPEYAGAVAMQDRYVRISAKAPLRLDRQRFPQLDGKYFPEVIPHCSNHIPVERAGFYQSAKAMFLGIACESFLFNGVRGWSRAVPDSRQVRLLDGIYLPSERKVQLGEIDQLGGAHPRRAPACNCNHVQMRWPG